RAAVGISLRAVKRRAAGGISLRDSLPRAVAGGISLRDSLPRAAVGGISLRDSLPAAAVGGISLRDNLPAADGTNPRAAASLPITAASADHRPQAHLGPRALPNRDPIDS
ncbi:MAG TPA: hypothetical protein VK459_09035, partial [Polyangiaceae bacterium]|nr:hypothetical protein [Polyangiaceae bacterium]